MFLAFVSRINRKDAKSLNVIKEMVSVQQCNYRVMDTLGRFAKHSRS